MRYAESVLSAEWDVDLRDLRDADRGQTHRAGETVITITVSVDEDGKAVSGADVQIDRDQLADVFNNELLDAKLRNLMFVLKEKILMTM